jgi:cytochrome b6-f complex iron-sulfur subunit
MGNTPGYTRSRLLGITTVGLGASIGGVVLAPVAGYLLAPVTEEATFQPVRLGNLSDFPKETGGFQPKAMSFVRDPTNAATSVELAYVHTTGGTSTDWLSPEAMFVVWSNHCTHVGCPVQTSGVGFSCPCHGSQFDQRGDRVAGPAVRPLDRFQWEIRHRSEVWLTHRWSVGIQGARVSYYPVKQPGQPLTVDGSEAVANALYPAVTYRS